MGWANSIDRNWEPVHKENAHQSFHFGHIACTGVHAPLLQMLHIQQEQATRQERGLAHHVE
jgi:hypothetical protein